MTDPQPPTGFSQHFKSSPFTDPWEPLYSRQDSHQLKLGTWLREPHCNSRGIIHGGFISTIADNAMGLSLVTSLRASERSIKSLVTVSLNVDFLGIAKPGDWLETDSRVIKVTRSLGFVDTLLMVNDEPIAKATATFKIS